MLVLVHGFCEDSRIFHDWAEGLKPHTHIFAPDIAGFGNSPLPEEFSMEAFAEDLKRQLDAQGIDQCTMVAHSMGGYVALAFAEKYPEYLNGLGFFHSHPYEDTPEKKENRLKAVEFVKNNGSAPYIKQLFTSMLGPGFAERQPELIQKHLEWAAQARPEAVIGCANAMRARPDRSEVLKNMHCPVMFIIGRADVSIPLSMSLDMCPLPKWAAIHLFEIGHFGMYEAPEETRKAVLEFLEVINPSAHA